jgi:hypothetical protein
MAAAKEQRHLALVCRCFLLRPLEGKARKGCTRHVTTTASLPPCSYIFISGGEAPLHDG